MVPLRCGSMAMAPMEFPFRRASTPTSFRLSTAVSSMRSPMSAAAQEKGRRWYKTGKLDHKINTFKDFISCGQPLVSEGLAREGNIVAQGGSAGGMLMGAVANMAPELFRGIVAEVPFVDVLTPCSTILCR